MGTNTCRGKGLRFETGYALVPGEVNRPYSAPRSYGLTDHALHGCVEEYLGPAAMADGARADHLEMEPEEPEERDDHQEDVHQEDVGRLPLVIQTVTRVTLGARRPWFPQCCEVDGRTFVTLSKNDPGLCAIVTGKCQNRHQKREPHSLNVIWWDQARRMRLAACSALVKRHMLSGVQEGETPPRFRSAREDDKWVISRVVTVEFPEVEAFGMAAREIAVLWSVKSRDIDVELDHGNLQYVIAALSASDVVVKAEVPAESVEKVEKASPKKKRRRLKRRPSAEEGGEKAEEG